MFFSVQRAIWAMACRLIGSYGLGGGGVIPPTGNYYLDASANPYTDASGNNYTSS
jgi:hypothetical protein